MQPEQQFALKEWAVVCAALASGRQSLLFRKGGIHEGPDGFQPEQNEFWLYPTGFHQSSLDVIPGFAGEADRILDHPPPDGVIPIQHHGCVSDLFWVDNVERLTELRPFHVLTDHLLRQRFEYRRPGLFVMVLQISSLPKPMLVPADPRYDGCRSWVRLDQPLPTDGLQECQSEGLFQQQRQAILQSLQT